jgi:hypothetical protein
MPNLAFERTRLKKGSYGRSAAALSRRRSPLTLGITMDKRLEADLASRAT